MDKLFYEAPWVPNFTTHPSAENAALECIIVEPRCHANLAAVLKNTSCMLPYAALTVYHSKENESLIYDILGNDVGNIKMKCFTDGNINRRQYCDLLCDPQFWDDVKSPKALIFQTDSGIRKNSILRFMEFDYIGAPWSWPIRGDEHIYVGNGGFSLRAPGLMKEICKNFSRDPSYPEKDLGEPEDIFFARTIVNVNHACLPTFEEASAFAVEHNRHPDPFGFHQAYAFHPNDMVERWMRDTDPKSAGVLIKVVDAWIESEGGRRCSSPELHQWVSLGIGSYGFRMPKNTFVTAMPFDIHVGYKKWLYVRFSNEKEIKVPLYQNRCKADISVAA